MEQQQTAKRIQAKELRVEKREDLRDVVPLSAPYVVYIDPTNLCNFRCAFCPTADNDLLKQVGRPKVSMSFDLFKKVIDEIGLFGRKLRLLSLYKDGEPTLHKNFPEMVRYAREANIAERIWTKTNGSFLNPELNAKLVDAGLDHICISIEHVSEEGYKKVADVKVDYEKLRANILDLYNRRGNMSIYIKVADTALTPEEKDKFYRDFQDRADFISIEKLNGWSYSTLKDFTLGTNPDTYDGGTLVDKLACAYPLYVMAVNSDGSVSVCGEDWAYKTSVGNVKDQTMQEIWNGEAMYRIREQHLSGRRAENPACATCYYVKIVPDNIDPYREELLAKLRDAREPAALPVG